MKVVLPMMALASVVALSGCTTLSETSAENGNRIIHTSYTNVLQIPDDAEEILLLDHPSWLSKDPIPNE